MISRFLESDYVIQSPYNQLYTVLYSIYSGGQNC